MRKVFVCIISCLLLSITLSAAPVKKDSPKKVCQKFVEAMANADFAKAKQYVSKEQQKSMDMAIELMNKASKEELEKGKKELKKQFGSVKIGKVKIDGDKAIVEVSAEIDGEVKTEKVDLVKENGKWKINKL